MNRKRFQIVNLIAAAALLSFSADAAEKESVQVKISGPEGMRVYLGGPQRGEYSDMPLVAPVALEMEPGLHQLKITSLAGREGLSLYPSLEVGRVNDRTIEFLDHAQVIVRFTEEDLDQALAGNFVTKAIFLPDPEFAELALAGVDTLVSTRLDPGVDPIVEADRRGAILAIIRLGNKDKELKKFKPDEKKRAQPEEPKRPGAKAGAARFKPRRPTPRIAEYTQSRILHENGAVRTTQAVFSGRAE